MQIELIETFLDLCATKSFNKTADRMGVTQSTVSGRIKSLEQSVDRRLFQRSRAGTELTTDGLRFEPHARALQHTWQTALHATRDTGHAGVTMRVGLQHDLVGIAIDELIGNFRDALPETFFSFEADYSHQMCVDLGRGAQDVAVLYSPQSHPDIHFEAVAEVNYVMVSSQTDHLADITTRDYILGNYAPTFSQTHAALLPELVGVSLSIGQNTAMVDLLTSLGGTAYVLEHSAAALVETGDFQAVSSAPKISQPVFVGINLRNRHRTAYRKLSNLLKNHYASTGSPGQFRKRRSA